MVKIYWYDCDVAVSTYASKALHALANFFVKMAKVVAKATSYEIGVEPAAKHEFELRKKLG